MKGKYYYSVHPSECSTKIGASYVWQRVLRVKEFIETSINKIVAKGEIDFWKERWWGEISLAERLAVSTSPISINTTLTKHSQQSQCCSSISFCEIQKI